MKKQEIKEVLLKGQNFQNDSANWYSLCNISKNRFIIVIADKMITYNNIDSLTKKIYSLLNKGV